ncbi:ABC transporter permease subunit [Pseudonocardia sp. CA-107938]|uniref:branched-chain amino acid ABC transporter permease n=1 Tax=Pseudonocardia sp. CA-107938 TaxID=3240021 RepID=UPI003D947F5D
MAELMAFALTGLGAGALFAGLALGVVINFRGCGAVNLGLGAVAMLAAFGFYELRTNVGLPTVVAVALTLVAAGLAGALFDWAAFRHLRDAPAMSKLIATLGLLLSSQAFIAEFYGGTVLKAPEVLPSGPTDAVMIAGIPVPIDRFVLAGLIAVVTLVLIAVYRWTRFGLATRAASENERSALLAGYSTNRLSLTNTTAAFVIAAGFGVLIAPITQLDSSTISQAIVPALAAALIAGFTRFGVAAIAGLSLGMIEALIVYLQTMTWFPTAEGIPVAGIADVFVLLVIVTTLFLRGKSLPQRGSELSQRLPKAPAPGRVARPAVLISAVVVLVLLVSSSGWRQAVIISLIAFVAILPFVVLVGYVGQLSVAQLAFAGVAGFATSRIADAWGLGFPLAPALGIALATAIGTLLALPGLRVRGVNLAIVSMATAVAIASFGFGNETWGARLAGDPVESPHVFGVNLGPDASFFLGDDALPSAVFGFFCLAVCLVLGLLTVNLRRGHLGHWMLAVRGNERAAAASGLNVRNIKVIAFAISSMLAGFAGVLYAYNFNSVSTQRYELMGALVFLAFAYIAGIGSVEAAVIAAIMALDGVVIHLTKMAVPISSQWWLIMGGLVLVLVVARNPDGLVHAEGDEPPPPFNWIDRGVKRAFRRIREGAPSDEVQEVAR